MIIQNECSLYTIKVLGVHGKHGNIVTQSTQLSLPKPIFCLLSFNVITLTEIELFQLPIMLLNSFLCFLQHKQTGLKQLNE